MRPPYFFIFLLLYTCVHGYTLSRSPLPWFDEVFFASLSHNFWGKGTFFVPNTVIGYEIKLYGFVYFALTGIALGDIRLPQTKPKGARNCLLEAPPLLLFFGL